MIILYNLNIVQIQKYFNISAFFFLNFLCSYLKLLLENFAILNANFLSLMYENGRKKKLISVNDCKNFHECFHLLTHNLVE